MNPESVDQISIRVLLWHYEKNNMPATQIIPCLKKYACRQHINWTDFHGRTFLHLAAARGDALFVKSLIVELGADWEKQNAQGKTPLAIAYESFCQAEEAQDVFERFDDCVNYLTNPEILIAETKPDEPKDQCSIFMKLVTALKL